MNACKTLSHTPNRVEKSALKFLFLCLIAVCCLGFEAGAANVKPFTKTKPAKVATPVITTFSPASGPVGTIITVNGNKFTDVSLVKIGNVQAVVLSRASNTITAMVMPGAVNGDLGVYNGDDSSIIHNAFTVTDTQPPVNLQADKVGYLEGLNIALSADGNTMAVKGAKRTFTKGGADHPPHPSDATVYKRVKGVWSAYAEITGNVFQLSADGATLINESGIYTDNGSGAFALQYTLPVTGSVSLSADGKLAIVGNGGSVYTYKNANGTWAPAGSSITEVSHSNSFGFAVSLSADGKTALVTDAFAQLPQTDATPGFFTDSLGAWVYIRNGDNWIKQTQLPTHGNKSENSSSPLNNTQAISADGNRIIINKILSRAIVFGRTGTTWSKITDFPYATGLGTVSMTADGKTVMFAKYGYNGVSKTFGVDIYKESGGSWNKVFSELRAPASNEGTTSGTAEFTAAALSADGSTAVTSTLGYWNSGVIVYSTQPATVPGGDPVSPAQTVSSITPASGPIGTVVTLSGSNLKEIKQFSIGGKPGVLISNDGTNILGMVGGGTPSGAVAITNIDNQTINSPANFNVTASPAIPLSAGSAKFGARVSTGNTDINQGYSVAISANGNTAVLGAPNYGGGKGALVIFTRNSTGGWTQQGPILVNPYSNPALGVSVSISADGNTVIGGGRKMQNATSGFLSMRTATVLFTRTDTTWSSAGDFGLSDAVALSGDGKIAVLGTVEPNPNAYVQPITIASAPKAMLTFFTKDSIGTRYNAHPPVYQGAADFISLAFSSGRTLVVGKPLVFGIPTTGVKNNSLYTIYGGTQVINNIDDQGRQTGGDTTLVSNVYSGREYEGSRVAVSGDGKVIISGGNLPNPVTFRHKDDGTWVQSEGLMVGANRSRVSLNVDGTVALVVTEGIALFYKWNGTGWGYPLPSLPSMAGLTAAALTPDAVQAIIGFAFDSDGGAAQVFNDANINLTSFSPASGPAGTIVTINGNGLKGLTPIIGGSYGVILSATNNTIRAMVTGKKNDKVILRESMATSTGDFTVTPQPLPTNLQNAKLGVAEGSTIGLSAGGNTMVVGKLNTHNSFAPDTSVVYKRKTNGTWYKYATLLANFTSNGGYRISADGGIILSPEGIFADNGNGTYNQQLALRGVPNIIDGSALNAAGDLAIISNTTNGTDFSLIPYVRTDGVWQQGASFTKAERRLFGSVLALSADGATLLVGDFGDKNAGYDSVGVYVYARSGNTFVEKHKLLSKYTRGEQPVLGISSDGNTAIVNSVSGGPNATAPTIYTRINSTWQESGTLPTPDNSTNGTWFASISFSADGSTVLAGNRLYKNNAGTWSLAATLNATFTDLGGSSPKPRGGFLTNFSALSADGSTAVLGQTANFNSGVKVYSSTVTSPPAVTPTLSSTKLIFSNITSNSTTVTWTKGNGSKRAVFIAKTGNGVAAPVNDTTYIADAVFGTGKQIGATSWYAIYNGDGNSVNISGLSSNTTYRVTVVEYNGVGGDEKYLQKNLAPASVLTGMSPDDAPTIPSSKLTFANITATTTNVSWTNGNGSRRAVFMARRADGYIIPANNTAYSANSTFAAGTQVDATGWYCVYDGTGNNTDINGLTPNTTYRVIVIDYFGTGATAKYMDTKLSPASVTTPASPLFAPATPSLRLNFTNITNNTTTVNWTSGSGSRRAVFMARRSDGFINPVDNTTYTANPAFAAGTQVDATGWYCVYDGTASSANVTGLTAGTTYRVIVVDYNGITGAEKYLDTRLAPASVTTSSSIPTIPSLKLTFDNITPTTTSVSWTSGNGSRRAVFMARRADGYINPVNNTTYTANPTFAAGSQVGATGWYCVYNGTGNNTPINGLTPYTTYRVIVIDYNETAGAEKYLDTKLSPASVTTLAIGPVPPIIPSLSLNFTNITNNATTVNWTSGNGARRAVFAARRSDGFINPVDNTTYTASPTFAAGTQVGTTGWYCVYDGTASSADITGLTAGTTYRVIVVDYNGATGTEKYLDTRLAPASVTTSSGSGLRMAAALLKTDAPSDETGIANIEASNLLSPNGDGKNDTWIVKNIEQYPNNSVTVYDQSNNVIYTKNGYTNDWAGTYRGGVVKEGTYYYLISLGNGATKKGFITVLSNRQ